MVIYKQIADSLKLYHPFIQYASTNYTDENLFQSWDFGANLKTKMAITIWCVISDFFLLLGYTLIEQYMLLRASGFKNSGSITVKGLSNCSILDKFCASPHTFYWKELLSTTKLS